MLLLPSSPPCPRERHFGKSRSRRKPNRSCSCDLVHSKRNPGYIPLAAHSARDVREHQHQQQQQIQVMSQHGGPQHSPRWSLHQTYQWRLGATASSKSQQQQQELNPEAAAQLMEALSKTQDFQQLGQLVSGNQGLLLQGGFSVYALLQAAALRHTLPQEQQQQQSAAAAQSYLMQMGEVGWKGGQHWEPGPRSSNQHHIL